MDTFSIVGVLIVLMMFGIVWLVGSSLWGMFHTRGGTALHCMTCGQQDKPKIKTRGNMAIELVLWLCFLVPGLIYSIWRVSTRYQACAHCGATTLVPAGSPAATAQRKQLSA